MNKAKATLVSVTLLVHPTPDAPTSIMVDVSGLAVGATMQQLVDWVWNPFSFF